MMASSVSPVPKFNLFIRLKTSPAINTNSSHCESIKLILLPRTTRAFLGLVHQYRSIHVNRTLTLTQEKTSLEQAIWPCQLGCLAQAQWSSSSSSSLRKVKQPPADQETATKVIIKITTSTKIILIYFYYARWELQLFKTNLSCFMNYTIIYKGKWITTFCVFFHWTIFSP